MTLIVEKDMGKRVLRNFMPPESVPIRFAIATLGARFGAQFLDILLTYGSAVLLLIVLSQTNLMSGSVLLAFFLLYIFFIHVPYYIFSELVWNGRTLGKRLVKIRVISADGTRLTPYQVTARNLMKEVEVFMPAKILFGAGDFSGWTRWIMLAWVIGVLLVPFLNKRKQRLGDMVAGTIVVEHPKAELLPDLSNDKTRSAARFTFGPAQLSIYGRYELQTLEEILRDPPRNTEARKRVSEVAQTIRRKIAYPDRIPSRDEWEFLLEFYRSQREFLESRHLLGDSRENKFHSSGS